MVNISDSDVADALHLDYTEGNASDALPTGAQSDIDAAEAMVGTQVEPHTSAAQQSMVDKCAVYVAAAFITGTEDDQPVKQMQRESQSVTFDTKAASEEATDYWSRAQAFDPTGRLGEDTSPGAPFRVI